MGGGIPFGNYRLIRRIARGGMAEVFLATQKGPEGFERTVALKRILPHLADSPEFVDMFMDEARLAARLTHPNIAHIYEFGYVEQASSYFIAMEFIDGIDLSAVILGGRQRLIPLEHAARIIADACAGLHYAHALKGRSGRPLGIVHRDISPQNILVSFDGAVKVVDFGIAKAAHHIERTSPGVIRGKYSYMAPEQVRGAKLDGRADIFCAGIVLYEMCTGDALFSRSDAMKAMTAIRDGDIPRPTRDGQLLPPLLEKVILRALAKDLDERYADGAQMQLGLEEYLRTAQQLSNSIVLGEYFRNHYRKFRPEVPPSGTSTSARPNTAGGEPLSRQTAAADGRNRRGAPGRRRAGTVQAMNRRRGTVRAEARGPGTVVAAERQRGTVRAEARASGAAVAAERERGTVRAEARPLADSDNDTLDDFQRDTLYDRAPGSDRDPSTPATTIAAPSQRLNVDSAEEAATLVQSDHDTPYLDQIDTIDDERTALAVDRRGSSRAVPPSPPLTGPPTAEHQLTTSQLEFLDSSEAAMHGANTSMLMAGSTSMPTVARRGRRSLALLLTIGGILLVASVFGYLLAAPADDERAGEAAGPSSAKPARASGGGVADSPEASASEQVVSHPRASGGPADAGPTPAASGRVTINSLPEGASVEIDDKPIAGVTPVRHRLAAGVHRLAVSYPGFVPTVRKVRVRADQTLVVNARLSRSDGSKAALKGEERQRKDRGDRRVGRARAARRKAEEAALARRRARRAKAERTRRARRRASQRRASHAKATPPAERGSGYLSIITIPWSNVYLGRRKLGVTPFARVKVPVGRHRLRISNPQLGDVYHKVTVRKDEVTRVRLRLK